MSQDAGERKIKATTRLRAWARRLKRDGRALYLACRDPRVGWLARIVAGAVVAYAFSPIDLIPDFIPILGLLDDLLLLPLGIALAVRLIPAEIMAECRQQAEAEMQDKPTSRAGLVAIVAIWLLAAGLVAWLLLKLLFVPEFGYKRGVWE